jgi:hypothetical protein
VIKGLRRERERKRERERERPAIFDNKTVENGYRKCLKLRILKFKNIIYLQKRCTVVAGSFRYIIRVIGVVCKKNLLKYICKS